METDKHLRSPRVRKALLFKHAVVSANADSAHFDVLALGPLRMRGFGGSLSILAFLPACPDTGSPDLAEYHS